MTLRSTSLLTIIAASICINGVLFLSRSTDAKPPAVKVTHIKESPVKVADKETGQEAKKFLPASAMMKVTKEADMKAYRQTIKGTKVSYDMMPIPGGVFTMGSPNKEVDRKDDEGPQHQVKIEPFWMGKCEVTWDEYNIWMMCLDKRIRQHNKEKSDATDTESDAVSRPTPAFRDMTFEMGTDGFPAICVTQFAAQMYCEFLKAKTGNYYRLPTEAEWEYACRAGTTTAYSWGDDPEKHKDYAWSYENSTENSTEKYHKVGKKKPNPWGLHDMHGNVSEWCLDQYKPEFYKQFAGQKKPAEFPIAIPTTLYPRVVRGGGWDDDPDLLRSAARQKSDKIWKAEDPQLPQSIWWHTNATQVGFRVIRPLKVPSQEEIKKKSLQPIPPEDLVEEKSLNQKCDGDFQTVHETKLKKKKK